MIAVVDYGMGNVRSVSKALESLGADVVLSRKAEELQQAERIILPGVGAFGEGMANLRSFGLVEVLSEEVLKKRKPFLGICLGMQLLADKSFEMGENTGLGWVPGEVRPLQPSGGLPVPHVGWNDIEITSGASFFKKSVHQNSFYFVHGYHMVCSQKENVAAHCDYGGAFTAAVEKSNILGAQFHPEKSQGAGLSVLRQFISWRA